MIVKFLEFKKVNPRHFAVAAAVCLMLTSSNAFADESTYAFIQSKNIISDRYPDADMPLADFAKQQSGNDYTISSNVTLKDSSGIKITRRFRCVIRHSGGEGANPQSWKLVSMDFGK